MIQEKTQRLEEQLRILKHTATGIDRRKCFAILHDALVHTRPRIRDLPYESTIQFSDLTMKAVQGQVKSGDLEVALVNMGWWLRDMN